MYVLMIIGAVFIILSLLLGFYDSPGRKYFISKLTDRRFNEEYAKTQYENRKNSIGYRLGRKIRIFMTVVGILMIALGLFIKYVPHGLNSIFSDSTPGTSVGEGETTEDEAESSGNSKYYGTGAENDESTDIYIRIEKKKIYLGSVECEDAFSLGERLKGVYVPGKVVYLVDDYAMAVIYHEVEEILADQGIPYKSVEKE